MRLIVAQWFALWTVAVAAPNPVILPVPQEFELTGDDFSLAESVRILLPDAASESDRSLARMFAADVSDRFGLGLRIERAMRLPASGRFILLGSATNTLVKEYVSTHHTRSLDNGVASEGYILRVGRQAAVVEGRDDRGAFYGLQSLRQLVARNASGVRIRGADVRDWPEKPFRGVKLYLPGRDNIPFFKRFVRDFMALYKYNSLILEVNAAMRLERHPELNAGWTEFAKDLIYSRRDRPAGLHQEYQDSTHHDTGDGAVLEQGEVAELVQWARLHYIEVIPEIPSLTHSYYLLTRHRELAEIQDAEWPDAYCPSNPKSYDLLFDVLDEYIDVMRPRTVHTGHDEWRAPVGVCARCRGKDPRELFAEDVRKIHTHLAQKNVAMAIWGDHLIEGLRGRRVFDRVSPTGYKHQWPGGLTAEQVRDKIPKDILIANWFWTDGEPGEGEQDEVLLENWGFRQFFGNLTPDIKNYERRSKRASIIGGAPSSWAATTEFNFGKDLIYDFLGCANLLWAKRPLERKELAEIVQMRMPGVRRALSGFTPPSADDPAVPINMGESYNATISVPASNGVVRSGPVTFDLGAPEGILRSSVGVPVKSIAVNRDASSIVFLHAADTGARIEAAYRYIYNFEDTADLLGYYDVVYEDGFVASVPIRYGVNILRRSWIPGRSAPEYVYRADPVEIAPGTTFFSFEWVNTRLGKVIKEIRVEASSGSRGMKDGSNAVLLKAISIVHKRPFPQPVAATASASDP